MPAAALGVPDARRFAAVGDSGLGPTGPIRVSAPLGDRDVHILC
jgi:hypothetical protein